MNEVTSNQAARGALRDAIARAQYAGQRTVLTVYGRPAAAVVSLTDLAQLEQKPPPVATETKA
jgi:hypothetical protein